MFARIVVVFAFAMAVSIATLALPLEPRGWVPSGDLWGQARWSDFGNGAGATAWYVDVDQSNTAVLTLGIYVTDPTRHVVGVQDDLFDKVTDICGRKIKITANGVTKFARVQERCGGGCGDNGLLLTSGLFSDFYPIDKGVFDAVWSFVDDN